MGRRFRQESGCRGSRWGKCKRRAPDQADSRSISGGLPYRVPYCLHLVFVLSQIAKKENRQARGG
jgi:hypothetical protein